MRKNLVEVAVVAVLALAGFYWLSPDSFTFLTGETETTADSFEPDDWTAKGPVPLPLLGRVNIDTGQSTTSIHPTAPPVEFDTSSALDRPTWKVVVVNQYRGRAESTYQWDRDLLQYMKYLKSSLSGVGLPTEIWFMRLNRPFNENGWTDPLMYRECGKTGSECFDEYLILAQSSLDYSLERDYLATLSDDCSITEDYADGISVLVVDPQGKMRKAYTNCWISVGAKHILRNFEHHTAAQVSEQALAQQDVPSHPAYPLKPWARESMELKARGLIRQAVQAASDLGEKAKESYDGAVESWK